MMQKTTLVFISYAISIFNICSCVTLKRQDKRIERLERKSNRMSSSERTYIPSIKEENSIKVADSFSFYDPAIK